MNSFLQECGTGIPTQSAGNEHQCAGYCASEHIENSLEIPINKVLIAESNVQEPGGTLSNLLESDEDLELTDLSLSLTSSTCFFPEQNL